MGREPEYGDVQGLARFGYRKMKDASYALLRVRSAEAARAWLRAAPVTSATTMSPPPSTALHVAFTAPGLDALGLPAAVRAAFSPEFLSGANEASRARRLGDLGDSSPARWHWGSAGREPHVAVMFFAEPGLLPGFVERATGAPWADAFEALCWLPTAHLDGAEPFGFSDGISQPRIDWERERSPSASRGDYANEVVLGEVLLGYRNEYDKYTDRPLLDATPEAAVLPAAEDAPGRKDLGRNGTYLVLRQLEQDVRGFWRFLLHQAGGDLAAAEALGAAFVGLTRSGEPLATLRPEPIEGVDPEPDEVRLNQFTYDDDPGGVRCPFGAHVRRANPRNADYPGRPTGVRRLLADLGLGRKEFLSDLVSPVRFHRVVRRGRAYGPWLPPASAIEATPPDDPPRGIHFVALNANICRQFEFLQNAWMANTKFSGLTAESDPLVGNREPLPGCPVTDAFTVPREGALPRRVSGLPRFVTVRGAAYFFLPGLRALRYLARG
jgi:deferrochelatase/peroxidase EfeB